MPKYTLDTSVYIDALRTRDGAAAMERFLLRKLPVTCLNAVVMQELRAGVRTAAQAEALERGVFSPFERRGRVMVPTLTAFKEAGRAVSQLLGSPPGPGPGVHGLMRDALLAASCRESGVILVTRDGDFVKLARVLRGFRYREPWPES